MLKYCTIPQRTAVSCLLVSAFFGLLSFGAFPHMDNVLLDYTFLDTEMKIGSVTMLNRLMGTPLLFLFKFTYSAVRKPRDCMLLKSTLLRKTVRKRDCAAELEALRRRRSTMQLESNVSEERGALGALGTGVRQIRSKISGVSARVEPI